MKNFRRSWIPFLFFIFALAPSVFADPISKKEADAWVERVRSIMGWSSDFDVEKEAHDREATARAKYQKNPNDPVVIRDLADALHSLGHFAEHRHDFIRAKELHEESLSLFRKTDVPTTESWDGVDHASEHIFMDLYDHAFVQEKNGDVKAAEKFFEEAYIWAESEKIAEGSASKSDRFEKRYVALVKRRGAELKQLSKTATEYVQGVCSRSFSSILKFFRI
jgi:hypothetical protein